MIGDKKKEVVLRVNDPDPSHVGRNIVTLDRQSKDALGVTSGDIVEVEGTRKTAAIIWPARPEDEGRGTIRMDHLIRHNCGIGLGEKVTVRQAEYFDAKRAVLAPTQEIKIIARGYDRILKRNFIGRPLTKGDHIWISVFGSGFVYAVVETNPRGIVKVTDFTQFILREEPVKDDLAGIPKIAYEDIGGLDEQIQKIREMIELPMRHPEIFRRLGITPPKGVLLHGPPGTGKTLLAKAVANETQAHFISVNSPSIMCVSAKTPILTNPSGFENAADLFNSALENGKLINDGNLKIVELGKPRAVYSLDKNLKIKKGKITHITKLMAKTFRVKTALGDEVVVSSNQPFALLDCMGNTVWKTASELKEGDLIAIAKELPEGKSAVFNKSRLKDCLSGRGKYKRKGLSLPSRSSKELMYLLGLMYSEGNLNDDGIQFSNLDRILLDQFSSLTRRLFGLDSVIKKNNAICYSRILRKFFRVVLEFPEGRKGDYSFPRWVFSLPKDETAFFIRGFWEGDGTVSKGTGGYPTIRIYSSTERVLRDLSVLSKKIGLVAEIKPWETKISDMHTLTYVGSRSRELFAERITSNTKKYSILRKWYDCRSKKGGNLRVPDISPLLKKIKIEHNLTYGRNLPEEPTERYISGRASLTQRKLAEIFRLFGRKSATLKRLVNSQISWARVVDIREGHTRELFDFSVEPFNNFLAGHSLMVLHNSKFVGEAEERIRDIFKDAEKNAPSIIFFDEIDAIAPKRDEVIGEVERRVVAQILSAMDGMEARGNVIVIAATNRVNSLDEALRRPGRFDREIEIGVPDRKSRKGILQIHTRGMPLAKDVDLEQFASITHGFVGADLEALAKEAAMKALRRYLPRINLEEETIPTEVIESLEVNRQDFYDALKEVQPSALREVAIEIPNVRWEQIGGLDDVKRELQQAVEWPLKYPDSFKGMGIRPPRGILLYGPPGTGKTLLAKAVATESEANFISVKGPQLFSMWVGESEKGVRKIFKRARQVSPAIVFFDEIDSVASRRGMGGDSGVGERVVNQLLTELDGIESLKDVVFIAATNRPDLVDPALLRPGRIDKIIKVPAPDEKARLEILRVHTTNVPLAKDISIEHLAKKTEGYSGADIEGVIREAALISMEENKMKAGAVKQKHLDAAMAKILPSISKETQDAYDEFKKEHAKVKLSYVG